MMVVLTMSAPSVNQMNREPERLSLLKETNRVVLHLADVWALVLGPNLRSQQGLAEAAGMIEKALDHPADGRKQQRRDYRSVLWGGAWKAPLVSSVKMGSTDPNCSMPRLQLGRLNLFVGAFQ